MAIALLVDDESPLFQLHMLAGLFVAFVVVLRLVWGIAGTRYARFGALLFGRGIARYLKGALQRTAERHVGHNPGSAYAAYAMLLLPLGLVATGILMGRSEAFEDVHEVLAWTTVAAVVAHLAGIAWHTIRHREAVALSMVDGKKQGEPAQAIPSSRPLLGLLFLALSAGWALIVYSGHDRYAAGIRVRQTIRLGSWKGKRATARRRARDTSGVATTAMTTNDAYHAPATSKTGSVAPRCRSVAAKEHFWHRSTPLSRRSTVFGIVGPPYRGRSTVDRVRWTAELRTEPARDSLRPPDGIDRPRVQHRPTVCLRSSESLVRTRQDRRSDTR